MSVLEEIKALEAKRTALLEGAKAELLDAANKIITELRELGFNYSLTLEKQTPKGRKAGSTTTTDSKKDREKRITDLLAKHPEGLFALQIHEKLGATDDAAKVRINNDLQALQRASQLGNIPASNERLVELKDANGKLPKGKRPNLWSLA